jgi:hypothetical protein
MKKLIPILLIVLLAAAALVSSGCKEKYVPEGPSDVNYGEVAYADYDDGTALTFKYLDCFRRSSDEDVSFVAKTADTKGVLSYEFFDSTKDYEQTNESYKVPSRKYAEIVGYTDEQALDYAKIALGMVSTQNAEYTVDSFSFDKQEHYVRIYLEATAEYSVTGEIQKLCLEKYVAENDCVYTLQGFVPKSCVTKYGPMFKDVVFDIENALALGEAHN